MIYIVCPSDPYEPGWDGVFATREAAQAYIDSMAYGAEDMCIVEERLR
jgi:hypothetical protein